MNEANRERALNQIVSLTALSEDMSTTEGERQAAKDTIAKLRAKYGIPEPSSGRFGANFLIDIAERAEKARRQREAADQARRDAEIRAWGAPLTDEERAEARRDPFSFAQKRDGRTHAEKQRDMNGSWGKGQRGQPGESGGPWCATPETFYDRGGQPRKRNQHKIDCDRCGRTLAPREGCVFQVNGKWIGRCCETRPGPRNRRRR